MRTVNTLNTISPEQIKYRALPGVDQVKILYIFQLGGGIKGRIVKEGDVITRMAQPAWHEDYYGVSTMETLRRISPECFHKYFTEI